MSVNPPEGTLTIENSHLDVKGNVSAVALKLGTLRLTPSYGLDAVANVSNSTTHTLELSNATTGLVTTSNLEVGGDVHIRGTTFIKANINSNNIAIGTEAGETSQGTNTVAVGVRAGQTTQGESAVAVGYQAGQTSQGDNAVAVGRKAGETSQGDNAIAVGWQAGQTSQGTQSIAIGNQAGETTQGTQAVAVGRLAGQTSQGNDATAVGRLAGQSNQGNSATAVGYQAGQNSQGNNAVAVGYAAGQTSQHANSIVLNASGSALNSEAASRFYVKPIRSIASGGSVLTYDDSTGEIMNTSNLTVTTTGNVGIGTDGPSQKLDVNGDIKCNRLITGPNDGFWTTMYIGTGSSSARLYLRGTSDQNHVTIYAAGSSFSDDRLKTDEELITDATDTLMKLSVQKYKKYDNFDLTGSYKNETGLIAQDIWYNAPELRHIVDLGADASGNKVEPLPLPGGVNTTHDIQNDPDYNALGWGDDEAGVLYAQLIPYLIKSNQEIYTELQAEKAKVTTLETQLTSVLTRLDALENA